MIGSEYDGDPNELVLGDEMEYSIRCKNGKISAETVVKLSQGTIVQEEILPEVYLGRVLRSLRRADPQVCRLKQLLHFWPFIHTILNQVWMHNGDRPTVPTEDCQSVKEKVCESFPEVGVGLDPGLSQIHVRTCAG